jgi:hypothetical protein
MRHEAPVFHDVYDLCLDLYRLVPTFPKAQRFVLGQRIEGASLGLLFSVQAALGEASVALDQLRLLLRLGRDLRFLSLDLHEHLILRCDEIGRQLGGWARWDGEEAGPGPEDDPC